MFGQSFFVVYLVGILFELSGLERVDARQADSGGGQSCNAWITDSSGAVEARLRWLWITKLLKVKR